VIQTDRNDQSLGKLVSTTKLTPAVEQYLADLRRTRASGDVRRPSRNTGVPYI